MKRIFLLLLTVIVCITCSGSLFYWPSYPTDPVLAPADVTLPEGRFYDLGDGYVLIYQVGEDPIIANLDTGSLTPVTIIDDRDMRDNSLGRPLGQLIYTIAPYFYPTGSRYATLSVSDLHGLIDRKTATITNLPFEQLPAVSNSDGTFLFHETNGSDVTLILRSLAGEELLRVTHSFGGYRPSDIYPLDDGYLLLLSGAWDADFNIQRAFVILDRELNAGPMHSLGCTASSDLWTYTCYQGQDVILLSLRSSKGLLVLSEDKGPAGLITWTEDGPAFQSINDADSLSALLAGAKINFPVNLIGVSADGKYALLNAMRMSRGLFKLDLSTMTFTEQMTHDEMAALGLTPTEELTWDGGDYAIGYFSLYRVTQR